LGRALALILSADGWNLGLTDISEVALSETCLLASAAGGKVYSYCYDVADKQAYKNAFDDFVSHTAGIDLLINNAGVGDGGVFGEYDLDNWDWIVGINQMGVIYGTHYAVPYMRKQQSGHIINIASAAGYATLANMSMYSVPKAAVIAFSETIYAELRPAGIQVSVAMPTFFRTNIMQHGRGNDQAMSLGDAMLQRSHIMPDQVAMKILVQAGSGRFHIFHPFEARAVWYVKRFLPHTFLRVKAFLFKHKSWLDKKIMSQ
jgi:short-subunit dehydrogenase